MKTRKKLSEYWDGILSGLIPSYCDFKKFEDDIKEHYEFISWMFKRIILPIIVFYVSIGFLFGMSVLGSLVLSLLIFVYSNFLPDADFLIKKSGISSPLRERYMLLFFAPVIIYYVIAGRAKPLYSKEARCFHNFKSMIAYGTFLLLLGIILWPEMLKQAMLPIFGMLGFSFHLIVDKGVFGRRLLAKEKVKFI